MLLDIELTLTAYCDASAEKRHTASENAFADQQLDRTMDLSVAINESAISNARMMNVIEDVDRQAQSISAAVDQMVSGISHIAENGRAAADNAEDAINVTRTGQETVKGAVDSMNEIANVVSDASKRVDVLAEASEKIGEIVESIEAIASETNLLDLNATIEAARAGDAGKGFAVVASEVKILANQTARATEEMSTQFGGIQDATEDAVGAIGSIGGIITQINEITSTIAAAVEEQGAATQEIARNVEQAAAGTREVSSNISQVTQAASETGSSATQILDAAGEMSRQSGMLEGEVQKFLTTIRGG